MLSPMKKLTEASYLTAENASGYRAVLRYFYIQHERMRDYLAPEEVLAHLQSLPAYAETDENTLLQQLAQLVKWGNLHARQDMTNARTIEEYKKKRFRYQATPYTIEIERMTIQLETMNQEQFGGSLEKSQFDRLLDNLGRLNQEITGGLPSGTEASMRLWEDILQSFQTIRTSTADYVAYIHSEQTDQRMQSDAFLVYKNQFTTYLRDFIISLQRTSLQIIDQLEQIRPEKMTLFIETLIEHRRGVPRLEDVSASDIDSWETEFRSLWQAVLDWFIGSDGRQSELEMLQIQTNEMIRRITRYVQRLSERRHEHQSRRQEYLHLSRMFAETGTIEEAHRLAGMVFGPESVRHLRMSGDTTDLLHQDVWDQPPEVIPIKPRVRQYREKTKAGALQSNEAKKEAYLQEVRREQEQERRLIDTYFSDGPLTLSTVERVQPEVRKMLLAWIGRAAAHPERTVKTDYGFSVHVAIHRGTRITLPAEDGVMTMPDVTFTIKGENPYV
ncbi:TIGR02677 family protein [Alkalicoccus urumqiensis]|uniref:TIGR02677 family protein n=1 Tax=Alkalicoccus urumqiensis TaxID=1548213 RepID=A0A2P6MJQ7_ALKUR|nr:TIGR02677 family protein [Alkalicoccus urumqiensis]PRO66504.1 TIGR02677 family protein [Alkalicoccus urumqiensis]